MWLPQRRQGVGLRTSEKRSFLTFLQAKRDLPLDEVLGQCGDLAIGDAGLGPPNDYFAELGHLGDDLFT